MKNILKLLMLTSSIIVLGACGGGGGDDSGGGGGGDGGGGTQTDEITVNFYADYNQVDAKNIYKTVTAKKGDKLEKPADPATAPMPEFPVFLGWSKREIIDDKKDLWDFSTDTVQTDETVFSLFGIWVAKGEQ